MNFCDDTLNYTIIQKSDYILPFVNIPLRVGVCVHYEFNCEDVSFFSFHSSRHMYSVAFAFLYLQEVADACNFLVQ